jgi:hypothetical protein
MEVGSGKEGGGVRSWYGRLGQVAWYSWQYGTLGSMVVEVGQEAVSWGRLLAERPP